MRAGVDWIPVCGGRTWQEALSTLRSAHGRGTSRWLAGQLGVSQRSAERYMAGAGLSAGTERRTPRGKEGEIIRLAAIAKLRASTSVWAGKVHVVYITTGRSEGNRNVGLVQNLDLEPVARALAAGDLQEADAAMSTIILDAYGDVGGTLYIDEYYDRPVLR